ncbi:YceD family protein [Yinghuangia sp. ASG 101]|uniref:YceD family protein n=1 Tax=Yinghuangia sp. ASG 101 TaxID=2896848 RepID=UPI001E60E5DA|nr:YceD family protein [Yinghuangia sp. ASG 101]UGQ14138.1 YceD family protein [Yinghuangia sp. ASG 101]
MRQDTLDRLDPRNPLVVDTRELGRRPGSMRRETRDVPAPADMRIDVIGVPEGAPLELELRLEAVMEGVLVSGAAEVPLTGECVRCLDPLERRLRVDFQELYVYPDGDSDEDAPRLVGDLLDLEPELRDAVVLALPLAPVCREDCGGLCLECGARLDDDPGHAHETADPRWAALQGLFGGPTAEADDNGAHRADENQEK